MENNMSPQHLPASDGSARNGSMADDRPILWLVNQLFKVDWNPLVENRRFKPMEGHLELFNENDNGADNAWKRLYFRTKDGRFQWFASHCADEHPISDILLTGTTISANKDAWTMGIRGGKEDANIVVRVPSNVFEKWHQALLSHASSSLVDAYIQPTWPPVPHRKNRAVLLELGRHVISAGVLTQKPSLPHSFFPTLCAVGFDDQNGTQNAAVKCGANAFSDHQTHGRQLKRPIEFKDNDDAGDSDVRRFEFDNNVLKAVLNKALLSDAAAQAQAMDISFRPQDYLVLLAIPYALPLRAASELVKLLLDNAQYGFKGVSVVRQPTLVLYSYDVTTGVVVDLGEELSIVPVIDEFIVDDAVKMVQFGAPQIREQIRKGIDLKQLLTIFGTDNDDEATEQLLLRNIVEKSCYIAADGIDEHRAKGIKDGTVEFVGQHSLKVNGELRFMAPEGLFKPQLWGLELPGLHRMVHDAIQKCPIDSRRMLYRNVYLTGGTSLFRGLAERLEHELGQLAPASVLVQVLSSPWRHHSTFLGAHQIAANEEFEKCCVTKTNLAEYLNRIGGE